MTAFDIKNVSRDTFCQYISSRQILDNLKYNFKLSRSLFQKDPIPQYQRDKLRFPFYIDYIDRF